nr:hypothetical protein [Nocardia arizonensis]
MAVYREPGEHGAVEQLPGGTVGSLVEGAGMRQQAKHNVELGIEIRQLDVGGLDESSCVSDLGHDGGLSLFEVFDRDGVSHIRVDQFRLLAFELDQAATLLFGELSVLVAQLLGVGQDFFADAGNLGFTEPDTAPALSHLVLDGTGWNVGQIAGRAAGVPSQAEEIVVASAFASAPAVADPSATPLAAQAALEIMPVLPGTIPGDTPSGQHVLHLLPGDLIHQRRMLALEQHALEADQALVVRIAE